MKLRIVLCPLEEGPAHRRCPAVGRSDLPPENCREIISDKEVRGRYDIRISELLRQPQHMVRTALFLAGFVHNSQKFIIETTDPPQIPEAVEQDIPKEDRYLVRAALISRPVVVTAEEKLLNRINRNSAALGGLRAITPADAIELAKDT